MLYLVKFLWVSCCAFILVSCTDKVELKQAEVVKVACVGNSITFGAGVANRVKNAYPNQLQNLLGNEYQIGNFGVSGTTLLNKGDLPYSQTEALQNALAIEPDVVFIMLGTNDSKLQNRIHLDGFQQDYIQLINKFKDKNEKTRVILMLPPPLFGKDTTAIWNPIIANEIIPAIQKVAYKTKSEVVDVHQLFVGRPDLFPDGIHPSSVGATLIAKRLYECLVQEEGGQLHLVGSEEFKSLGEENFYGYGLTNFEMNGIPCKVVAPKKIATGNPWVLRARFWGHEPQTDIALLERGFHIVYCEVSDLFGSPKALDRWTTIYELMTKTGLSKKVVLEGMSRGGLVLYNWAAENPEKVACVYADAPVLDGKSWPGGFGKGTGSPEDWKQFKKVYGLETKNEIASFDDNPIHKLKKIAKGGFPMFHVCGAVDKVVPVEENTIPFVSGIKKYGGNIQVIYKDSVGHHPHSLDNPTPIVDFILRATRHKINFASLVSPGSEYRSAAGWTEGKGWWAQMNDIDSLCINSGKVDVLLLGNSITQGFGGNRPHVPYRPGEEAVATYFKELKIIGAGISGDRTEHLAWRLKNGQYEKCDPTFVTLAIGVNNFADNTAKEIVKGIALDLTLVLEKFPTAHILFFGPLPTGLKKDSEQRKKYDEIHSLISHLEKREYVHYYNMVDAFCTEGGDLNEVYYGGDGIHLKPEGYMVWTKFIAEEMKKITKNEKF